MGMAVPCHGNVVVDVVVCACCAIPVAVWATMICGLARAQTMHYMTFAVRNIIVIRLASSSVVQMDSRCVTTALNVLTINKCNS